MKIINAISLGYKCHIIELEVYDSKELADFEEVCKRRFGHIGHEIVFIPHFVTTKERQHEEIHGEPDTA